MTDWKALIQAAPKTRAIKAREYIDRAATSASSPQKYLCGQNRDLFCVKFHNNKHGDGRALVAEHIVGRCGKLIVAPVGAVALVAVSAHLSIGVTLTDGTPVVPGIHHGTRWMDGYGDRDGVQHVDENRESLGALEVLYTWMMCSGDHQLIYSTGTPSTVASVDHSQFLPGGGPGAWTPDLLRADAGSVTLDAFFGPAALGPDDRYNALLALARVNEEDIAKIVAGPPEEWGVQSSERPALAEFLWMRRERVLELWPKAGT